MSYKSRLETVLIALHKDKSHEENSRLRSLLSLCQQSPPLVCAVHPEGVESDKCLDFRLDTNAEIEKQWNPQGYSWYGNELISNRPRCGQALSRYSQSEQLEILDNHPFFTSVCPQCRHEFNRDSQIVHYDCPDCGWIDDSV